LFVHQESFCLAVRRMMPATRTELLRFQAFGILFLVLRGRIVAFFAVRTLQRNNISHNNYARISVTVPAPTVRPPSRIANLNPFSIATTVINSMLNDTLSPGITISVPSGNVADPVTSVVRK